MSFREKSAWGMMAVLALAGLYYFKRVIVASLEQGAAVPPSARFLITYIVAVIILSVIVNIAVSASNPNEAEAPADEREALILARAGQYGGIIMGIGVISALWHFAFNQDGNLMFHIVFGSLMTAQFCEYALQVYYLRWGA